MDIMEVNDHIDLTVYITNGTLHVTKDKVTLTVADKIYDVALKSYPNVPEPPQPAKGKHSHPLTVNEIITLGNYLHARMGKPFGGCQEIYFDDFNGVSRVMVKDGVIGCMEGGSFRGYALTYLSLRGKVIKS